MTEQTSLMSPEATQSLLRSWGLSQSSVEFLQGRMETVNYLRSQRDLESFPVNYTPAVVEILYEDVIFFRYEVAKEEVTFCRPCPGGYDPSFSEWKFDGKCAFFQCGEDVVINRIDKIAKLDEIVGFLD